MALTFNGAWGPEYAGDILDVLDEYDAKATLFVLNAWLEQNPDLARKVVESGHEIAMHSATHPDFARLTTEQIHVEVRSNCLAIVETTGAVPRLFRAPSGSYSSEMVEYIEDELGFKVIQWSLDSVDWRCPGPDAIRGRIIGKLGPGDIVLFHTNVADTVKALPSIIEHAADLGLELVTVSEMLLKESYEIDWRGRQRPRDKDRKEAADQRISSVSSP